MLVRAVLFASALSLTSACSMMSNPQPQRVADTASLSDSRVAEIGVLNHLASIFIDSNNLYAQAAELPDSGKRVPASLNALAEARADTAVKLQSRVTALGGEADTMGEPLGSGHVAFMYLRTALDNDTEVAVEEAIRGEEYIRGEIETALTTSMTAESRALLQATLANVTADLVSLEQLNKAI